MDSGNSGSMHSSSAGDEEYDSRTLSPFFNAASAPGFLSLPPASLPGSTSHGNPTPPPSMFDPFSHSSYGLEPVWPDPAQGPNTLPGPSSEANASGNAAARPDQAVGGPVKNPRKRTRASRRAPTTVLTTDTSNFRQMVQEFTGIPAPPFSAASALSPYSRRLDLFGQLYPFRPSAQKVVPTTNIAAPATSNSIFSGPYGNQLVPNSSGLGGFTNSLQNQLLSNQSLMFGSSKSTQGNSLIEMGITQDHLNANLTAFLNEGKGNGNGNGRENNGDRTQENNAVTTRNEENVINAWNFTQEL